ncbi:transcriptional regulator family: Fungal Specific TF [Penicillium roqueforti]|uniref:Zn(2)-C6 fungal-type DNA-binding domain n=1 Tax=Penicillium roqueforti (strain FM164) TaxID=1365484 RepID=W6QGI8_PENRF|nr:transcriptional regulator family: Fungal Specific TF [Penicillium roqueforti]CDM33279.1 Zn(2)-C6 fungal-type DNA-binding domain [Penicillium roqueforti FM164]KAI2735934.1 transcriptional regulator family: Fungal Specific TF [Penicillium roqueforti]KAI2745006.1 transcriptional regulator family: Fungal Specific TF [Penicillium roqueforti]KAI2770140.1 transcriptional regulator family: Fungal Specific TF [Penicillium roqueforti]
MASIPQMVGSVIGQYQAYGPHQRRTAKAARAAQACDRCRAKKAKCDEGRPNCGYCRESNLPCSYKEESLRKENRSTQTLLDHLTKMEDNFTAQFRTLQNQMLSAQGNPNQPYKPIQGTHEHSGNIVSLLGQDETLTHLTERSLLNFRGHGVAVPNYGQNLGLVNPIHVGSKLEAEYALSTPVQHTAARNLLLWPSIQQLLPDRYDEDYVIRLEEERGLLSTYDHGEMLDTLDNSPLPLDPGVCSHGPDGCRVGFDGDVDIDMLGNVKLGGVAAQRYFGSYLSNMYKLHPFLDRNELDNKVNRFIQSYCHFNSSPGSVTDCVQPARDEPPSKKRRSFNRSLGIHSEDKETCCNSPRPRVDRNIHSSIVLLCLALGAICEAPTPLSGSIMNRKIGYRGQRTTSPLPAHIETDYANGALSPTMRNEDANTMNNQSIPGITLYRYATGILSHLQGANELEHVQAGLLAGLYAGQLAHPFQSHSWISQASRACQVLTRPKRYESLNQGSVKDLHSSVYWACLELESDLLAGLDLPASGISHSEGRMHLPKGQFTISLPEHFSTSPSMIMMFYYAQIHLRKILNRVPTDLYKIKKQGETLWSYTAQGALSENLDLWRRSLPDSMQWKETDEPANEINAAHMRATYYGALYIIHRPFLYHALHGTYALNMAKTPTTSLANGSTAAEVQLRALPENLQDAYTHRLVVTNIFGTAHSQFGNMLVLSATYMSSLSKLVAEHDLERILKRTIGFLVQNGNISPTIRADARMLTEIYQKIFHRAPDLNNYTLRMNHQ